MAEEVKETQYQRKKRLAAEKAAREASETASNPFNVSSTADEESVPGASVIDTTVHDNPYANHSIETESYNNEGTQFDIPDNVGGEDDWLSGMDGSNEVDVVSQINGDSGGYEPITEECIFALNYKESNTVVIRPYPIMIDKNKSVSVFNSIMTMICDPCDEKEPIFCEISPRVANKHDDILDKMLNALSGDTELRKKFVRTIDNKYFLGQILSNKNNPDTVGRFVLFRVSYTLSKAFEEQGLYGAMAELVQPSNTKAIVVDLSYDASRSRRIQYNVSLQSYDLGHDKLVKTSGGSFVYVGTDIKAYEAWKAQFYAAFKGIKEKYNALLTSNPNMFTPEKVKDVQETFARRYQEAMAMMTTSAGTAASAIAQGVAPQIQVANPFAAQPAAPASNPFGANMHGAAPQSNPFAGNMGAAPQSNPFVGNIGAAPSNPFGAASSPSNGGFGDM